MVLAFLPGIGPSEMLIVGVVAVLLFGNKLPQVMGSVGKSLSEFRKGMRGIEDELHAAMNAADPRKPIERKTYRDTDDRVEPSSPKFEPPQFTPPSGEPSDPASGVGSA